MDHLNEIRDIFINNEIIGLQYCMNGKDNTPEDFDFGCIQGSEHGFDFVLKTKEIIHFRINQFGNHFGLDIGKNSILETMNPFSLPTMYDYTNNEYVNLILNKKILKLDFHFTIIDNSRKIVDKVKISTSQNSFYVLCAEYFSDDHLIIMGADEATIVFDNKIAIEHNVAW